MRAPSREIFMKDSNHPKHRIWKHSHDPELFAKVIGGGKCFANSSVKNRDLHASCFLPQAISLSQFNKATSTSYLDYPFAIVIFQSSPCDSIFIIDYLNRRLSSWLKLFSRGLRSEFLKIFRDKFKTRK